MLTSFKLTPLVLGVTIRADTTGARLAAQQLRQAVAREFARVGGLGLLPGGGGTAGLLGAGGGGSNALAIAAGSALGGLLGRGRGVMPRLQLPNLTGKAGLPDSSPIDVKNTYGESRFGRYFRVLGEQYTASSMWEKRLGASMISGIYAGTTYAKRALSGVADAFGLGLGNAWEKGAIRGIRATRRLWTFLIGALVIGTIQKVIQAFQPALRYIRATGAGGRYGEFSGQAFQTSAALKNVAVQFGLMEINVLKLNEALSGFNRVLI
jgi:hypothetical protein